MFFRIDKYFKKSDSYWKTFNINPNKTQQEIAGYSHASEVQEVVNKIHETLKITSITYLKKGTNVLDIGCGPGLFLKDFGDEFKLYGIDLSSNMLNLAKDNIPNGVFYEEDFLKQDFQEKFSLIYSVGALQYFSKNDIEKVFDKMHDLLSDDGVLFISYPHAISSKDLSFPDLNYISYSPSFLNKIISRKFILLQNKHVVDDRVISDYDSSPYKPSIPGVDKIYRNSSILIARKR